MIELRVTYLNSKEEILRFNHNKAVGEYISENVGNLLNIRKLDNRRKIRIITKDNRKIIRAFDDDMTITEGICYVIDLIKLEEDRIKSIDILERREK